MYHAQCGRPNTRRTVAADTVCRIDLEVAGHGSNTKVTPLALLLPVGWNLHWRVVVVVAVERRGLVGRYL